MTPFISIMKYAKAVASLIGAIATALSSLELPAPWNLWVTIALVVATAIATWAIPNYVEPTTPAPATPPAPVATVTPITSAQPPAPTATNIAGSVDPNGGKGA